MKNWRKGRSVASRVGLGRTPALEEAARIPALSIVLMSAPITPSSDSSYTTVDNMSEYDSDYSYENLGSGTVAVNLLP